MFPCINQRCDGWIATHGTTCPKCGTPGMVADRFEIQGHLKPGVYTAWDRHQGYGVVVKLLLDTTQSQKKLYREWEALKTLQGQRGFPAIYVHGAVTLGRHHHLYLALEKIEGISARQWLQGQGHLSKAQAKDWLAQGLALLKVVHGQGLLHRDIKPENIMVGPDRYLTLIDFGASRFLTQDYYREVAEEGSPTVTCSGGYTPPEQMDGKTLPQSDLFALARTLVHLATGIHPVDLVQGQRLHWHPQAKLSRDLATLVDQMMDPDINKRPGSSAEALWRLENLRLNRVGAPLGFLHRAQWRSPWVRAGALAGVVVAIGFSTMAPTLTSQHYLRRGNAALRKQEFAEAEGRFRLGLTYSKTLNLLNGLAVACEQQGDWDCAAEHYQEALALEDGSDPTASAILRFNVALNYDRALDFPAAETHYREAIALGFPGSAAHNNLSRVLILKLKSDPAQIDSSLQEAVSLASQGLGYGEEDREVAGLLKNRGWAQLLLGDYGLAGQDLARAIHLNPDRPDLYFLTAQLLEKQGKMAEALPYWRQGLALSNLNPPPSDLPEQVQWHNQAGLKIRNAP